MKFSTLPVSHPANAAGSSDQITHRGTPADAAAGGSGLTSSNPPSRSAGNYQRIVLSLAVAFLLTIITVSLILIWSASADAYPQANDTQYKKWALQWHNVAKRERITLVRHTDALGLKRPRRVPTIREWTVYICETDKPNLGSVDFTAEGMDLATAESRCDTVTAIMSWRHYGADSKRVAKAFRARTKVLHHRITHPGGSSNGKRWIPLARYVGWPESTLQTLAYIIMRESSGRAHAYNGVIGCSGLLQIWPGHVAAANRSRLFDPEYNLRVGLRLWLAQGWSPWRVS